MSPFRSYHVLVNFVFLWFFHLGRICDIESIHPFHLSELVACGDTLQVGGSNSRCPSASQPPRSVTVPPTVLAADGIRFEASEVRQ